MINLSQLQATAFLAATLTAAPAAFADSHVSYSATALADVAFSPIGELPIEIAVLWGNPQEGPSAVMMRFPPNFPGGMHVHTHGYHALVISGASRHWDASESEVDAPLQRPGDYWYQSAGAAHQDSFPTDQETVLFLQFEGPIDTVFVD